uniref:Uncharacterized protein n=1 Tax=Salix viminalis TaxID=40686 RepID=A0A6N2L3P2_SALVM
MTRRTNLRAHNRKYEAVFDTAPSTNSMALETTSMGQQQGLIVATRSSVETWDMSASLFSLNHEGEFPHNHYKRDYT